ncbi:MAG: hypothetical protein K2N71_00265 [Oscillospiraceae bacterium]|nr:hypothetical protein [Oscillospiraceae bacterium]
MKKNFMGAILLAAALLTACEKEQLIDETEATRQTEALIISDGTTTAAVSAVEPSKTTLAGFAESKAETSETTETEETTAAVEQENTEGEEMLLTFLESLQAGENKFEHGELGYGDPFEAYDFMDDFTIDDYSYEYRGDGIYDVTLNCSDNSNDIIPVGVSEWVFNSTYETCFIPAEREENRKITNDFYMPDYDGTDSSLYSAYCAALDFSMCTGAYEADSEWFENFDISNGEYSAEQYVHWLYHAYNPYFTVYDYEKDEGYDVTPEEFAAAVKKLYNINITAEQAKSMTDETGFIRKICGHGKSWLYHELAGYEETDAEINVTVNYYGDSLYFYPTVQSEYTFSKNVDGTITLQKVEKIFDRGYGLASGTI